MKVDLTRLPVLEMIVGFLLLALAATFIGAFAATDDIRGSDDSASETAPPTQKPSGSPASGKIAISMEDNKFGPAQLTLAAGSTVSFEITNDGRGTHNMRIAGPDGEYDSDDDGVSDPKVMRGGSSGTLEWAAPDQPGEIKFRCDFHPDQMTGTIAIQ